MPLLLAGILLGLGGLAAYEVFVANVPLSSFVPWWHPSVGPALANAPTASAPATQSALMSQAIAQASAPAGPHVVALPFAHTTSVAGWQAQVNAAASAIQAGLPIMAPDQVSQVQRALLLGYLANLQAPNVTKATLQQFVVQMSNASSGVDANAAAAQVQPLLQNAPAGA